jgi:hypothetical protein
VVTVSFGVARSAGTLFSWFITPVYFAYFLTTTDVKVNAGQLLSFLKLRTLDVVTFLFRDFVGIIVAFFHEQMAIASWQGLLFADDFSRVDLNYGFVIDLLLAILNVIPYFGRIISLAIAIPLAISKIKEMALNALATGRCLASTARVVPAVLFAALISRPFRAARSDVPDVTSPWRGDPRRQQLSDLVEVAARFYDPLQSRGTLTGAGAPDIHPTVQFADPGQ